MKKVIFKAVSFMLLAATVGCFATACGKKSPSGEYAFTYYYEGFNLENQV